MRKPIEIKIGESQYQLLYTVRSLERFEQYLGTSLFSVISSVLVNGAVGMVQSATIHFIISGLRAGLLNQPKNFDAYDFVDMYCENGGNIGELAKYIVNAVVESGLFTQGTPKKEAPMKKKNRR